MDSVSLKFYFLSLFINLRTKFRKLSSPLIVFLMASPICYTALAVVFFLKVLQRLKQDALSSADLSKRILFRFIIVNIF